ncbi:multiple sugar transport system permease protein/putative aldouronate transport system permease protein [Microbacterium terrae]|uniref:Lactose transport system permease protein LacG n=1 Tax=Microbacterium terrae TaxID=69369 RepID=A0A0M2HM15_9MICO|nr:carbohydrate ABC transporter permease [Microbacterium terrae]KJL45478.1 Lactose transport system permease protein LacG [Microbacterium terrae]MBP1079411.1 multiple sugar transport system permease protein/putative aldouronate transport system permease protein [Microbacterium terrae]GLJ98811.1 sugar ABC transporter permease [Microbacterium terrae]
MVTTTETRTLLAPKRPAQPARYRMTAGDAMFRILNYTVFAVFTVICAYPFYYLIINSVSANDLSALGDVRLWPIGFHLDNYTQVFQLRGLPLATAVSIGRTVLGTAATVLASAFLGFMFTQSRMWGRQFWYRFIIITMYFSAGLIPVFIIMKNLGLTNNFWVYVLPFVVQPFNIILVKTFVESMPRELQEAAEVDGANILQIFFRIYLPNMTPILATIAIFSAVMQWNSFQDTLIYVTDQSLYTLQYLLYMFINQASSLAQAAQDAGGNLGQIASAATTQTPTSIRMTVSVLVVLPIIFIYPLFQRFFVKGIMLGAVKG